MFVALKFIYINVELRESFFAGLTQFSIYDKHM